MCVTSTALFSALQQTNCASPVSGMQAGLLYGFYKPSNSDMDYTVFNVRILSFCMDFCTEFDSGEISAFPTLMCMCVLLLFHADLPIVTK